MIRMSSPSGHPFFDNFVHVQLAIISQLYYMQCHCDELPLTKVQPKCSDACDTKKT